MKKDLSVVDWELKNQLREIRRPKIGKLVNLFTKYPLIQFICNFILGEYVFDEDNFKKRKDIIDNYYNNQYTVGQLLARKAVIERKRNRKYGIMLPILISLFVAIIWEKGLNTYFTEVGKVCIEWKNLSYEAITKIYNIQGVSTSLVLTIILIGGCTILLGIVFLIALFIIGISFYFFACIVDGFGLGDYTDNEYILFVINRKLDELNNNSVKPIDEDNVLISTPSIKKASVEEITEESSKFYTITIKEKR